MLLIGSLVDIESYGYLLLLISAEAIFGTIVSYPQIKEILFKHQVDARHFYSTGILYLLLLPVILCAAYLYFNSSAAMLAISLSVFFFAGSQTALYVLRVANVSLYNRTKVYAAVLSTVVFMVALPYNPNFLPLSTATYFFVLFGAFIRSSEKMAFDCKISIRELIPGWLIFGSKSLLTQLGLQGNRFVIGVALSIGDVAIFVKSYMIASGITFIYAAIMIKYEKGLSKEIAPNELKPRLRKSFGVAGLMCALLLAYIGVLFVFWDSKIPSVDQAFKDASSELVLIFSLFFIFQAFSLAFTPVLIASGKNFWSLMATVFSLLVQVLVIICLWENLTLSTLAWSMVLGHVVLVGTLVLGNIGSVRSQKHQ
ncbi:hypothetical protein [Thauera linaloolentis]|uniref:hypothetical protein n=1 Tax=Thauera linaloolentis TaxID=76112 RepID=UPI0012B5F73E|nr:hypothetical protein [Thauera linaloolentis]MCM8566169.1 hypothetical protein [Thauera linaloolentis]